LSSVGKGRHKPTGPLPDPEPVSGAQRDTTHIAIIDRNGKYLRFDAGRRLDRRCCILGNTGVGMSVRDEQFWLDKPPVATLPRCRARDDLPSVHSITSSARSRIDCGTVRPSTWQSSRSK
jgi:hypothetical protein